MPGAVRARPRLPRVSPTYKMPEPLEWRRQATLAEVTDALAAARCAVELAGSETDDFLVRELLVQVIQEIDRAVAAVERLV